MTARYTFFELATQNGFVVAQMAPRMRNGRFGQISIDNQAPGTGRVFRMYREVAPEVVEFEFHIPDRATTESVGLWEGRAKRELDKAWKLYERERDERKRAKQAALDSFPIQVLDLVSGTGTSEQPDLGLLNDTPSSTKPQPSKSDPSGGESPVVESVPPPSDTSPPSNPPAKRSRSSSPASGPRSRKSA